ncbi:MAG: TIGR03067 domain-containing protein [Gemmataceae bacterium]
MRKCVVALTVCLLLGADKPADAVKADMAKLEGDWSMVSGEIDGSAMPAAGVATGKRTAKDGETKVVINGMLFIQAKYTVDPSKKPKTIDYAVTGGFAKGKTELGIYEIDGDTVKFCFASPGKERPTDFTTKPGSGRTLSVWKREKK